VLNAVRREYERCEVILVREMFKKVMKMIEKVGEMTRKVVVVVVVVVVW